MRFRLTNTGSRSAVEFEADDPSCLRYRLNPAITAMVRAIGDELGPEAAVAVRFEVQTWDERAKVWAGPHLPRGNYERWVEPLKSDDEARWLWERLSINLSLDTADFKGFKAANGDDTVSH